MKTAIILGREHGAKTLSVLSGPDRPIQEQLSTFKEFMRSGSHPKFEHVELWASDSGRTKQRKLSKPKPAIQSVGSVSEIQSQTKSKSKHEKTL